MRDAGRDERRAGGGKPAFRAADGDFQFTGDGQDKLRVGVPLVVYASTMIREAGAEPSESDLIVTPKDVDLIVEDCAAVIAAALNKALGND